MNARSDTQAGRSFDVTIEHCAACKQSYRLLLETDRNGRLVERIIAPCACGDSPVRAPVERDPVPERRGPRPTAPGARPTGVKMDAASRELVRELAELSVATGEGVEACRERIRRETGLRFAECTVRRYMLEAGWIAPRSTRPSTTLEDRP